MKTHMISEGEIPVLRLFICIAVLLLSSSALIAAPANVEVYPGDINWFSYIPGTGSAGITATNPRSGRGSLELSKGLGNGTAFISAKYDPPFGVFGDLSAMSFDWLTDPASSQPFGPDIALRVYPYDDPRTFFLQWQLGYAAGPTGSWQHSDALGHLVIQSIGSGGTNPPATLADIPADASITELQIRASYSNATAWHGFVDNFTVGFTGSDPVTYNFEVVPEPASIATIGLSSILLFSRRKGRTARSNPL